MLSSQKLSVDQKTILPIIQKYLISRDAKRGVPVNENFVALFDEGHCTGFSTLKSFAMLISAIKPDRDKQQCDDNEWFENCRNRIVSWNGKDPDEIAEVMEPFIAKLVFFQREIVVLPLLKHNATDLHKSSYDEKYHALEFTEKTENQEIKKINHLEKDDTFSFNFTSTILPDLLEAAIPEDRMILLSSVQHTMCAFKHQNELFYFDPRFPEGTLKCANFQEMAAGVERTLKEISNPNFLSVEIYRFSNQPALQELPSEKIKMLFQKERFYREIGIRQLWLTMFGNASEEQTFYSMENDIKCLWRNLHPSRLFSSPVNSTSFSVPKTKEEIAQDRFFDEQESVLRI